MRSCGAAALLASENTTASSIEPFVAVSLSLTLPAWCLAEGAAAFALAGGAHHGFAELQQALAQGGGEAASAWRWDLRRRPRAWICLKSSAVSNPQRRCGLFWPCIFCRYQAARQACHLLPVDPPPASEAAYCDNVMDDVFAQGGGQPAEAWGWASAACVEQGAAFFGVLHPVVCEGDVCGRPAPPDGTQSRALTDDSQRLADMLDGDMGPTLLKHVEAFITADAASGGLACDATDFDPQLLRNRIRLRDADVQWRRVGKVAARVCFEGQSQASARAHAASLCAAVDDAIRVARGESHFDLPTPAVVMATSGPIAGELPGRACLRMEVDCAAGTDVEAGTRLSSSEASGALGA